MPTHSYFTGMEFKKNRVIHIRFWVNYIILTRRLLPQERKKIVTERNILRLYKPAIDVKKIQKF